MYLDEYDKDYFWIIQFFKGFLYDKKIRIQTYWDKRNTSNIDTKLIRLFKIDTYFDNVELFGPYCYVSISFAIFWHSEFTLKKH